MSTLFRTRRSRSVVATSPIWLMMLYVMYQWTFNFAESNYNDSALFIGMTAITAFILIVVLFIGLAVVLSYPLELIYQWVKRGEKS